MIQNYKIFIQYIFDKHFLKSTLDISDKFNTSLCGGGISLSLGPLFSLYGPG